MKGKYDEHYKNLNPQPIEVIENWELDFHLANVLKYISRAGKKEGESELKDLEKAKVYLDRKIERLTDLDNGMNAQQFKEALGLNKVDNNDYGYKEGQVWTCAKNPEYTLTIGSILNDGRMIVKVTDGDFVDRIFFTECGRGDEDNYYDFQLTVLKRDVEDGDE